MVWHLADIQLLLVLTTTLLNFTFPKIVIQYKKLPNEVCKYYIRSYFYTCQFCSVIQSCLTLQSHGLKNARPPCPSPTPRACSNSCPLSRWCHPTISASVIPFSSCLQSFPASGSFPMNQLFISGSQSIGVSVSASVLPMNILDWFPFRIDWFDLLAVQGTLKSLLQHHSSKASILWCSVFFMVQLPHLKKIIKALPGCHP